MDDNLLRKKVLPRWQHRAIADITRQDVRTLVEECRVRTFADGLQQIQRPLARVSQRQRVGWRQRQAL